MITLWGRRNSINVMKVMWCLDELGLEYQRIDAGMAFGVVGEADYGRLNPNRKVPTIADGDTVLWESNVIVRYLAARYGEGRLCPSDPAGRARCEQWMDWQQTTLHPDLTWVFQRQVRTNPEPLSAADRAARGARLAATWTLLDVHLAGRDYIAGDEFTMADIPLGAACWRWLALDLERPPLAHLEAWHARLCQRPAFREHVMQPLS